MTEEEAKKMGATHVDHLNQYFHLIENKWFFFSNILGEWVVCNPPHNIKPL